MQLKILQEFCYGWTHVRVDGVWRRTHVTQSNHVHTEWITYTFFFTQSKAATCCNHILSLLMSACPVPTPITSETVFQTTHYINALWVVGVDTSQSVKYKSSNHLLTFRSTNFVQVLFRDSVSIMQKAHIVFLKRSVG
jgi:hypothetical protein